MRTGIVIFVGLFDLAFRSRSRDFRFWAKQRFPLAFFLIMATLLVPKTDAVAMVIGVESTSQDAYLHGLEATGYISFSYANVPLPEVIEDLGKRYELSFIYSPTAKLMACMINARSGLIGLEAGIERLFEGTPIEYRIIGGRVAVRYSKALDEALQLSSLPPSPQEKADRDKKPSRKVNTLFGKKNEREELAEIEPDTVLVQPRTLVAASPALPREIAEEIPWRSSQIPGKTPETYRKRPKQRRLARVSVLPGLSSAIKGKERELIHSLSFNLPAGVSGGLVGAEIGAAFNGIDGSMEGVQISGGLNMVRREITGVQIALLGNTAGIGTGIQIGGGFNYCRGKLEGTQIGGLLNVALDGANSQYSLGANLVQGTVRKQVGLFNRAVDVEKGQFGLINLSDTIGRRSFGLINFVRKGYNTIEVARNSLAPYSVNLKMGSHRLYNVFELSGGRRDLRLLDGTDARKETIVWGVGYGFGWANRLGNSSSTRSHTELVATHLNRGGRWRSTLNLVGSIRWTLDWRTGKFTHLFIGPVMNLHWTQLSDEELDGMLVSGWELWSKRYDKTAFRGILGIRFGARIGQH